MASDARSGGIGKTREGTGGAPRRSRPGNCQREARPLYCALHKSTGLRIKAASGRIRGPLMNQDSARMDRSLDVLRAAPRRRDGADGGNESLPASGNGSLGTDVLLDPLRLNDAMPQLWSRLAADPSPLVGTWVELAQSWSALWAYGAARMVGVETEPAARPDEDDRPFQGQRLGRRPVAGHAEAGISRQRARLHGVAIRSHGSRRVQPASARVHSPAGDRCPRSDELLPDEPGSDPDRLRIRRGECRQGHAAVRP